MDRNTELLESFKVDPLKEVWDAITRIRDDQAKMRGEVDGLLERESTEQSTLDALNALTSRVTPLEAFQTATEVALEGLGERVTDLEAAPPDHTHIYADITDTHNNTAHNPDNSVVGHTHPYSDVTGTHDSSDHTDSYAASTHGDAAHSALNYAAADHDNGAHSVDFATTTVTDNLLTTIDNTYSYIAGVYNSHTHTETGSTTSGPSATM